MKQRVGVYGSACNPPHNGHADVIAQALDVFERVIVVPSYKHPFGKEMANFDLRMLMVKAMVDSIKNADRLIVSDVERSLYLQRPGPVYTYRVLAQLDRIYPEHSHVFVAGPDVLHPDSWNRFFRSKEIMAKWGVWKASESLDIRSSKIRPLITDRNFSDFSSLPVCEGVKNILMNNRSIYDSEFRPN